VNAADSPLTENRPPLRVQVLELRGEGNGQLEGADTRGGSGQRPREHACDEVGLGNAARRRQRDHDEREAVGEAADVAGEARGWLRLPRPEVLAEHVPGGAQERRPIAAREAVERAGRVLEEPTRQDPVRELVVMTAATKQDCLVVVHEFALLVHPYRPRPYLHKRRGKRARWRRREVRSCPARFAFERR
jgi:hypothetical protein